MSNIPPSTTDLETPPVLLLVFNRPEITQQVFDEVRKARPARLYLAADGPRGHKAGEAELCAEVRQIVTNVDWPCEVKTLFRTENLGCKRAVAEAITWLFDHEEQGIILEDDCLPAPDFFRYCAFVLERWRDDPRVMHVGGTALVDYTSGPEPLIFSRLVPITGWATWRRAWRLYDPGMSALPKLAQLPLNGWYGHQGGNVYRAIRQIHDRGVNAWGARWVLSVISRECFSILPRVNLISNVGYGPAGTNTTFDSHLANLPTGKLAAVLTAPDTMQSHPLHDEAYLAVLNRRDKVLRRAWRRLTKIVKGH